MAEDTIYEDIRHDLADLTQQVTAFNDRTARNFNQVNQVKQNINEMKQSLQNLLAMLQQQQTPASSFSYAQGACAFENTVDVQDAGKGVPDLITLDEVAKDDDDTNTDAEEAKSEAIKAQFDEVEFQVHDITGDEEVLENDRAIRHVLPPYQFGKAAAAPPNAQKTHTGEISRGGFTSMSDAYERVKGGRLTFKGGALATRSKDIDKKKKKKKNKMNNKSLSAGEDGLPGDVVEQNQGEEAAVYTIDPMKKMKYDELFPVECKKFGYDPNAKSKSVEEALDDRVMKKADRYCK